MKTITWTVEKIVAFFKGMLLAGSRAYGCRLCGAVFSCRFSVEHHECRKSPQQQSKRLARTIVFNVLAAETGWDDFIFLQAQFPTLGVYATPAATVDERWRMADRCVTR